MDVEDYIDFLKDCKANLKKIEELKRDTRERPPKGVKDWSDAILKLAKNQVVIAHYMAMMAGVDDYAE